MEIQMKCSVCQGTGKILDIGSMVKKCTTCDGKGYITVSQSSLVASNAPNELKENILGGSVSTAGGGYEVSNLDVKEASLPIKKRGRPPGGK